MERDLHGKVAIITGGAEGLGYSIADFFLKNDAKAAVLLDINENLGSAAATTLNNKYGPEKAIFFKCDVTSDLDKVSKIVIDKFTSVDILVNNAGIFNEFAPKKTMDINATALVEWSLKFWEHMRKDKKGNGGTIINMSSIYGFKADQFAPVYHASKFAVVGFTRCLGHQYNYERSGVRVYAICPGFTQTSITKDLIISEDEQVNRDFKSFTEQSLWQQPSAVGRVTVETFAKADSGTVWFIHGDKPITQINF